MMFNTGAALLDAVVLAVAAQDSGGTYGYKITQDVRAVLDVSESALYPVLRRLQTGGLLRTYDQEFNGRNRRYYKITAQGKKELESYRQDWKMYTEKINDILFNNITEEN
ncbi:MAG: PadR family transcriptional regulator [Treponema sp.]|nr:PadR family transcriptional regulator [Treponema sp.]